MHQSKQYTDLFFIKTIQHFLNIFESKFNNTIICTPKNEQNWILFKFFLNDIKKPNPKQQFSMITHGNERLRVCVKR